MCAAGLAPRVTHVRLKGVPAISSSSGEPSTTGSSGGTGGVIHTETHLNSEMFCSKRNFAGEKKIRKGFVKRCHLTSAASSLTENIEFGPPGAQGGLRGLTLVQRVIRQLRIGDLQVVLADVQGPQHTVPGPGCRTHTHRVCTVRQSASGKLSL